MSKLGQMHHEELGQWGWAAGFHPTAEVSRSSSSFTGSIIVTETECDKSCKFGPFHLNSAKTKKLGHNDGSLNKGKQPHTHKKNPSRYTWCSWQVCPMLKSTQGPSLQPLFGWDTNAAAINEDSWACGPCLGIFWHPPDWASAPSPRVVRSLTMEAHCVPNCMQGSRGQASCRMDASIRKVNCLDWLWSGLRF